MTKAKLRANAVTSAKVKDGSLRSADFAAGQLPRGEAGPPGAEGAQGPAGPQGAPAASMLTGRSTEPLSNIGGVEYLSPSGAGAPGPLVDAAMLAPARPIVARDLAIRLSKAVNPGWSREFQFVVNGSAQQFGCEVPASGTTCTSGDATLTIPAGARFAIRTTGPGSPGDPEVEFGWRALEP